MRGATHRGEGNRHQHVLSLKGEAGQMEKKEQRWSETRRGEEEPRCAVQDLSEKGQKALVLT